MKKIILLIASVFLLAGCEAIYTVEINPDFINEILVINNPNQYTWYEAEEYEISYSDLIVQHNEMNIPIDFRYDPDDDVIEGVDYYEKEKINTVNNLGLKLSSPFKDIAEYSNSTIVNAHMSNFGFSLLEGNLILNKGMEHFSWDMYPLLTAITVRVVVGYDVNNHNADEDINNVLYWTFTKENYESKEIILELFLGDDIYEEEVNVGRDILVYVYIGVILVIFLIGVPVIYFKIKNSNN